MGRVHVFRRQQYFAPAELGFLVNKGYKHPAPLELKTRVTLATARVN